MDERSYSSSPEDLWMIRFKGILFDFDGTLADTMPGHYMAWKSALSEHGIDVQANDYYPLEGMQLHEIAMKLTREQRWTRNAIDELVQRKKRCYVNKKSVRLYPGVNSLIAELKAQRIPMGIVTAGHLDQLQLSAPIEFLKKFDALITGDQVSKGKPHPEPYLRGAKALGLDPQECIAVENAPLGVQSAKQAGTYCIAICSTVSRQDLLGADEILDRFEELKTCANLIF
ncbi:MAG: HAD family phosphatase [Deltaproteobacteria bacterium]|nr:HAD family phosphatase [Deltaproteobacteria bacterium]